MIVCTFPWKNLESTEDGLGVAHWLADEVWQGMDCSEVRRECGAAVSRGPHSGVSLACLSVHCERK